MRNSPKRTIWERVREAFDDKGYDCTQVAVAAFLGIKQGSISDWNKPGKGLKLEHAIKIAEHTGVCVEWLLTERGPKHTGPPRDAVGARLWTLWHKLDDEAKLDAWEAANRRFKEAPPVVEKKPTAAPKRQAPPAR